MFFIKFEDVLSQSLTTHALENKHSQQGHVLNKKAMIVYHKHDNVLARKLTSFIFDTRIYN